MLACSQATELGLTPQICFLPPFPLASLLRSLASCGHDTRKQKFLPATSASRQSRAAAVPVISINFHVPSVLHMCNVLVLPLRLRLPPPTPPRGCIMQEAGPHRKSTCRMQRTRIKVEEDLLAHVPPCRPCFFSAQYSIDRRSFGLMPLMGDGDSDA